MKGRLRALLVGVLVVGVSALSGGVTYGAFNSTRSATSNTFATGGVSLSDNDGATALFTMNSARPGATSANCIQVTSTGSVASNVSQYATLTGALPQYLKLKVTRGTDSNPSFGSCANFTADACDYSGNGNGVVYNGTLSSFPTTAATALPDRADCTPSVSERWMAGEAHSYRYDLSFAGTDPAAEKATAGVTVNWRSVSEP